MTTADLEACTVGDDDECDVVRVGSEVRFRVLPELELDFRAQVAGENGPTCLPESVVTIVAPGEMGLYRLTPETPLARALLGHRVGDVVRVRTEARTLRYEVLSIRDGVSEQLVNESAS